MAEASGQAPGSPGSESSASDLVVKLVFEVADDLIEIGSPVDFDNDKHESGTHSTSDIPGLFGARNCDETVDRA